MNSKLRIPLCWKAAHRYHLRYVHSLEGSEEDWHPFFNATWPMEDNERTLLQEYGITYVLADPDHAALIDRKLRAIDRAVNAEFQRDGYVLFKLSEKLAGAAHDVQE